MAQIRLGTRAAYLQLADDLRRQIVSGELAIGAQIPSTAQLMSIYGVSNTVVRSAITELRYQGLLVGHAGKGVYVQQKPSEEGEALDREFELATRELDEANEFLRAAVGANPRDNRLVEQGFVRVRAAQDRIISIAVRDRKMRLDNAHKQGLEMDH